MKKVSLLRSVLGVVALILVLGSGCSEKSTWRTPDVVLESIPTTVPPRIDGKALDREWFSAPELLVAMGDENGNQGGSFYLRIKSVYTPYPDTVYFLLQWADSTEDALPDRLIYTGDYWHATTCASDFALVDPQNWTKRTSEIEKEDRFAFMFEITPASDATGTFASNGCRVACHGDMHPAAGKLDVWYWMFARTNPVSRCDDLYSDAGGLTPDEGEGTWRINWRDPTFVPKFVARGDNGGLSSSKTVYDPGAFGRGFNQCDTVNPITSFVWNHPVDPEVDYVPGYLVRWPTGSRGDIVAKGAWDENTRRWTVELKRAMRTGHEAEDVFFYPDRSYNFAIAIMNGSRQIHSGSAPLVMRFRH